MRSSHVYSKTKTLPLFVVPFFIFRSSSLFNQNGFDYITHSALNVFFITFSTKAPFIFLFNSFYFPINLILDCFIFIFIPFCQVFFFVLYIHLMRAVYICACTFIPSVYTFYLSGWCNTIYRGEKGLLDAKCLLYVRNSTRMYFCILAVKTNICYIYICVWVYVW